MMLSPFTLTPFAGGLIKGPKFTVLPSISGTPEEGEILTCNPGTAVGEGTITYSYQWYKKDTFTSAAPVKLGVTTSTYGVQITDVGYYIYCRVTATDNNGKVAAKSNELGIEGLPIVITPPMVTGSAMVGEGLSVSNGVLRSIPDITGYAYQWQRDGDDILGATSNTYTTVNADINEPITCVVSAANAVGSIQLTAAPPVTVLSAPINTAAPALDKTGNQPTGTLITCGTGTWLGTPTITYSYQWLRGVVPIAGATSNTYTIVEDDDGETITCEVTATNAYGEDTVASSNNAVGQNMDPDYAAVLLRAVALGDTEPAGAEKLVAEQVMIQIKAASVNALSSWSLLRFYGTNKNYGGSIPADLGYTGVNWASPSSNVPTRLNTITQIAKKGYHGNATDAAINEAWNPATSGLSKTDFLWFSVVFMNGFSGQAYKESIFNATFDSSMQLTYPNNSGDTSGGRIFSVEAPDATRTGQIDAPTYQRLIMWRIDDGTNDYLYLMINGVQHGPFTSGSDTAVVSDTFHSLCRTYSTGNKFDFLGDNIVKTAFGFGKASEIDKEDLDAALEYYIDNL